MKRSFFIVWIFFHVVAMRSQTQTYAPVQDTITVDRWEDAMELTFGLLNKRNFPSGYLFNKVAPEAKLQFADGTLNDSSFNMIEFYFLQNVIRMSYNRPDSILTYLKLDSTKNIYIAEHDVLPIGVVNIKGQVIRQNAFQDGYLSVEGHRLVENTSNADLIYETRNYFCVAPLNLEVNTLNPRFIIRQEEMFSNATAVLQKMEIDPDDGIGFRTVQADQPFQVSYGQSGFKVFTARFIYSNGDTLYSRSELKVNDQNILQLLSSNYAAYDYSYDVHGNGNLFGNGFGNFPSGEFTGVTYDNAQNEVYVQVGVWNGCGNTTRNLRKPYIIFGGYNPRDGKSLEASGVVPWINQTFGALNPFGWLDGWRGPSYETMNGFFTDFSKNAAGGQAFGDNGARILDKLRQEGYDVCIVRFKNGIGYLQTNAYLASLVLKEINFKILNDNYGYNMIDAGAALDPEANGYPNSSKIKRAKHELVVGGYSAGALTGRMALTLMEYEHKVRNQCIEEFARKSTHHRTKIWVGVDHECQGSNTPIGMQMFWDFQKSLALVPANFADVMNTIVATGALGIVGTNGIATQNTLYHLDATSDQGGTWTSKPHDDFVKYFKDLEAVTHSSVPANLNGYPVFPYRISISQGSAKGIDQTISNNTDMLHNQSPSSWCVSSLGTAFGVGNLILKATPFRQATARVISGWNNDAFNCKVGTTFRTLVYSWHVNFGHWKYYGSNPVNDWWQGGPARNYDDAAGSTLPSNLIYAKSLSWSNDYPLAPFLYCNLLQYPEKHAGFATTVSGLDLHYPGNNSLPRFPDLSIVPGNVNGGLNLMQQNNYNNGNNTPVNEDFGYPHLTFPNNRYDYTPYDAIWANTTNDIRYDENNIHVEDPNPLIGDFLTEEMAPSTLYLSNRLLEDQMVYCGTGDNVSSFRQKYYADFEARNSILAGDQNIYQHENDPSNPNPSSWYPRKRTAPGDFVVGEGAVVTFHANNYNDNCKITLGAGFSSKHGSIFRAYIYRDPNLCEPFSYNQSANRTVAKPEPPKTEPRPVNIKRANAIKNNSQQKINLLLYPNPTQGELIYVLSEEATYNYQITTTLGQVLQTGSISKRLNRIDLDHLPRGVYMVTVSNKTYLQTDRIILQ